MPAISILLPVRDAGPWLATSLASLRRQTFRDFEIVAVDDGSRDDSLALLEATAAREPRLRVVATPARGLPAALAEALARAGSPLIARHDADDVSHRERLARQVAALRADPSLDVVGTRLRLFPRGGHGTGMARWAAWHNRLLEHDAMHRELLIDSPLAHGTAVLRREALERAGGWRERGWAEDLDLWIRLFENGSRFAKLPQVLYGWRQHPRSATRTDPRYHRERFIDLKRDALLRGLLAGRRATLVGVGRSLERWHAALGGHVDALVEARRPSLELFHRHSPPFVLAFGAAEARERWRQFTRAANLREISQFVFVA